MGLGIDILQIDESHGFFYVHREDSDRWNRYKIKSEKSFMDFVLGYEDSDLSVEDIDPEGNTTERYGYEW